MRLVWIGSLRRQPAHGPLWRFDAGAAAAMEGAEQEARALGHGSIGSGHLLLALASADGTKASAVLYELGLDEETVRTALREQPGEPGRPSLDPGALATLGIDLDEVRRRVEETFGAGALDRAAGTNGCLGISPGVKQAFHMAAMEAAHEEQLVSPERLLLAICGIEGSLAERLVAERGAGPAELQRLLDAA